MTINSSQLVPGTRGVQPYFILSEAYSPNGYSRKYVTVKSGVTIRPGDLVDYSGDKITKRVDAANIVGIALEHGESGDTVATLSGAYVGAEVKDTIFAHNGVSAADKADIVKALADLNIDIVTCSPDATF